MNRFFLLLFVSLYSFFIGAQQIPEWNVAKIQHEIQSLDELPRVMYLAAHPDDENTRMISWLSNVEGVQTSYLSLTRGDGGQNLVGPEKGAELGIIRSQELLGARSVDGGEQYFTRAIDFGYSKRADEVLEFWNEEEVLSDVVRAIRMFKPHVIITRFPPTSRAGHGMHTASAMLAESAFEISGDSIAFPDQLIDLDPWQVERLYFNTSTWWYPELKEMADTSDEIVIVDIGAFIPLFGVSSGVIAGKARTMHKSQGFGSSLQRGERTEYLKHVMGSKAGGHILEGLDRHWRDIGYPEISNKIEALAMNFNPNAPEESLEELADFHTLVLQSSWSGKESILESIEDLMLSCSGTWFDFTCSNSSYVPGTEIGWTVNLVAQRISEVHLLSLNIEESIECPSLPDHLGTNENVSLEGRLVIPESITQDYWLTTEEDFMYTVEHDSLLCLPSSPNALECTLELLIEGVVIERTVPLVYKWTDRVKGELTRDVAIVPLASVNSDLDNVVFPQNTSKSIDLKFIYNGEDEGSLSFVPELEKGWTIEPNQVDLEFEYKGQEKYVTFNLIPPKKGSRTNLSGYFIANEKFEARSYSSIEYDHFTPQVYQPSFSLELVRFDLEKKGDRVAYIKGAGDVMPEALMSMGYEVDLLEVDMLPVTDLASYKAVICGIRAYNTQADLYNFKEKFNEYIFNGGVFVVQYNTNRGINTDRIGPYPFALSRDRVSEENAEVTFLAPNHKLMNEPNKLSASDFDGWVQERGLYFPNEWSEEFTPLFSWGDFEEEPKEGALIAAEYGEGLFVYTSISFFRQMPGAVPGAYRLFANIVSWTNE